MIIGIGGLSRSGKSSIAKRLRTELQNRGKGVLLLHQDAYPQKVDLIPVIRDRPDFESPASIDWEKYLHLVKAGIDTHDVVISEGLFAFNKPELDQLYDRRLVVFIDKKTFLERKATDTRWGPVPPMWYQEHIWEAHERLGKCSSTDAIRIDGRKPFKAAELIQQLGIE